MNVVFFMQDTGAVFGAERATIDLAVGLRANGDTPRIVLMVEQRRAGQPSGLQDALRAEGLPVNLLPVRGRVSRALAAALRATFIEHHGDVLHVIGYKANLHARLAGIRPVVATVHGWLFRRDVKERIYDAIDRWCLRRCDRVVCLSRYYEQLLLDHGVAREALVRIPSGLRELPGPVAPRAPVAGAPVTFGMMGRFSEEKNHALFVEAARQVVAERPEARFVIAGQGPLEAEIRAAVKRAGLEPVVSFPGYTSVAAFMGGIDVYVMCSTIENLPYSILEAMAWSRPVIGTHVGGIPDLVDHGRSGRLVPLGDAEALSDAMLLLVRQPERIPAMGAEGKARLDRLFSWASSVKAHQGVYRNLVEAHRG